MAADPYVGHYALKGRSVLQSGSGTGYAFASSEQTECPLIDTYLDGGVIMTLYSDVKGAVQRTIGTVIPSKVSSNQGGGRNGRPYSTGPQRPAESRAGFLSDRLADSPAAVLLPGRQYPNALMSCCWVIRPFMRSASHLTSRPFSPLPRTGLH